MTAETHLAVLLKNLRPRLDPRPFVFCCVDSIKYQKLEVNPVGLFREAEGVTLILEKGQATAADLAYTEVWALITLSVHSGLTAVGFLAATTAKLALAELSVNAISAFYHDHLFVLWQERDRAMTILKAFEGDS